MSALVSKMQWPEKHRGLNLGRNSRLAVSFDDGTTWTQLDLVKDVTINHSIDAVDSESRRSGSFKSSMPGKIELSIDAEVIYDAHDPVLQQLRSKLINGGIYKIGAFTATGNGFVFYACLTDFTRNQPLGAVTSITTKHALVEFCELWKTTFSASSKNTFSTFHPINLLPDTKTTSVVVLKTAKEDLT